MPTVAAAAQAAPGVLRVDRAGVDLVRRPGPLLVFPPITHRLAVLMVGPPELMVVRVVMVVRAVLAGLTVQRQQPLVEAPFVAELAAAVVVVLVPATPQERAAQGAPRLAHLAVVEQMERRRLHLALPVHRVKAAAVVDRTQVRQAALVALAAWPAVAVAAVLRLPGLIPVPVGLVVMGRSLCGSSKCALMWLKTVSSSTR